MKVLLNFGELDLPNEIISSEYLKKKTAVNSEIQLGSLGTITVRGEYGWKRLES